jgi:hypothetical protein
MLTKDSLAFELFCAFKYFRDFMNFIQIFIAKFSKAINKPFATLDGSAFIPNQAFGTYLIPLNSFTMPSLPPTSHLQSWAGPDSHQFTLPPIQV